MRRITTWLLSTVTALVLLFSYHTSTDSATPAASAQTPEVRAEATSTPTPTDTASGESGTDAPADTGDSADDTTGTPTTGSTGGSTAAAATTYVGDAVMTRFGNVQVQITVQDGKVTTSEVTQVPWSNGRDQQINSYAVPILNSEAVAAQSADIDMVSGATYTSDGYIQSLQSALDLAGI